MYDFGFKKIRKITSKITISELILKHKTLKVF
jgi:hypothetical protein